MDLFRRVKRKVFAVCRKYGPSMYLWPQSAIMEYCRIRFADRMGYELDLNNPASFSEKLQWYKLYYKNPEIKDIVDKYNFKNYIADHLGEGHTIPLYEVWENIQGIEASWPSLPECFVLKSTIAGNGERVKIIRHKSEEDFSKLKEELKTWFDPRYTNLNSTLTGYYDCIPRIIAEKYEENISDQLYDYKFFCFSGEPRYVYVATDHLPGQVSHISFYDLEWNRLDVQYGDHPNCAVEKPKHFDEMLEYAKKLSKKFPFVRVDFFDTGNMLYLAEMTFYPGSGYVRFSPDSFNQLMGDLFLLPKKNEFK